MRLGRPSEALPYLYNDLASCRAINDRIGEAKTLNTIGLVWMHLGRLEVAVTALELAVEQHFEASDVVNAGHALSDLGLANYVLEQHEVAYECHVADFDICQKMSDRVGMAKARIRMADNLLALSPDNASLAMEDLKQAKVLLDATSDDGALLALAAVLGEVGFIVGDIDGACKALVKLSEEYAARGDHSGAFEAIHRLSSNLIKAGRAADCLGYVRQLDDASATWPIHIRRHIKKLLQKLLALNDEHDQAERVAEALQGELRGDVTPSPDEFIPLAPTSPAEGR